MNLNVVVTIEVNGKPGPCLSADRFLYYLFIRIVRFDAISNGCISTVIHFALSADGLYGYFVTHFHGAK